MPNTSDDDSELSRCWRAWIVQRDGGTEHGKLGALNELRIAVMREMDDRNIDWDTAGGIIWRT